MTVTVNISTPGRTDADVLAAVAGQMRARRHDRRLSLDQLSARSGVSKGMLVQIENGKSNPSIGTLCKIAAALGASVADLVDATAASAADIVAAAPRVLWRGRHGGSARLMVGSTGPDMLELWCWEMRPGERYDAPAHPSGTRELLHVTSGRLAVTIDASRYVIAAGRSASAATDRPHAYTCAGRRSTRFTMVVAEPHR